MANIAIQNKINRGAFSTLKEGDWVELTRRLTVVMDVLWQIAEQSAGTQLTNINKTYYSTDAAVDPTTPEGETPPTGRINGTLYVTNPDGSTKEIAVVNGWMTG